MAPLRFSRCLTRLKMLKMAPDNFMTLRMYKNVFWQLLYGMAPSVRLRNAKYVIFIDFWIIFMKSVWKIAFFIGNAYYKNGAITNFVLFHTLKTVWEWRQTFNLCLKYAKTWINTLYLEWRHFLVNIRQNVNFPLIFQGFSSKNAKKVSFSA